MGIKDLALALSLAAQGVAAQSASFQCFGRLPSWNITNDGVAATFDYSGQSDMTVTQYSRAEGRGWPLAMTLISFDLTTTAILLVHYRDCHLGDDQIFEFEAQVVIQRQDAPVVLDGCCRATSA